MHAMAKRAKPALGLLIFGALCRRSEIASDPCGQLRQISAQVRKPQFGVVDAIISCPHRRERLLVVHGTFVGAVPAPSPEGSEKSGLRLDSGVFLRSLTQVAEAASPPDRHVDSYRLSQRPAEQQQARGSGPAAEHAECNLRSRPREGNRRGGCERGHDEDRDDDANERGYARQRKGP
jgi:hypothetical protein